MSEPLPVLLRDRTYTYVYGLGLVSQTNGGGTQSYFLQDGLGSAETLVDGSGDVAASYRYDAFGAVRKASGLRSTDFCFTGEQWDILLGYTCLRAKYHSPAVGRFISRDTYGGAIRSPLTLNRYSYVESNPINAVDPSGLSSQEGSAGNDCFDSPFQARGGSC